MLMGGGGLAGELKEQKRGEGNISIINVDICIRYKHW